MLARRSCEKVDLTPVMGHPGHRGGRTVRLVRARTRRLWTDSVGPARDSLPTLALRASRCALRAICESDGQPRPRTRIGDLPWPTISCVRTRHRAARRLALTTNASSGSQTRFGRLGCRMPAAHAACARAIGGRPWQVPRRSPVVAVCRRPRLRRIPGQKGPRRPGRGNRADPASRHAGRCSRSLSSRS